MHAAKATGLDNISVKLLKITSDEIVDVLTFILIFSIETNCVENDCINARVTPIF